MTAPMTTAAPPIAGSQRVTFTRRFFGDYLLEGVLAICTLGIGWFIWLAIVAPKGQSPAKSLLKVFVIDEATGQIATAGKVWLRDGLGKIGIPLVLSLVGLAIAGQNGSNLSSLYSLIGGIMILASSDNKGIWDKFAGTHVVYMPQGASAAPAGFDGTASTVSTRLAELEKLRELGAVTDVEYMERRRKIIDNV